MSLSMIHVVNPADPTATVGNISENLLETVINPCGTAVCLALGDGTAAGQDYSIDREASLSRTTAGLNQRRMLPLNKLKMSRSTLIQHCSYNKTNTTILS